MDAAATVTRFAPAGMVVAGRAVVEVQLIVTLPGGIPMPVTHSTTVEPGQAQRLLPGARIAVSLDTADPASLRIEWSRPSPV